MSAAKRQTGLDAERKAVLERALGEWPAADGVRATRQEALQTFADHGFPTRREEAFKYTDLKAIAAGNFDVATETKPRTSAPGAAIEALLNEAGVDESSACAVFVDGSLDQKHSRLNALASGLTVTGLANEPDRFDSVLSQRRVVEAHPLASLNTAFAADGIIAQVAKAAEIIEPLHIFLIGTASGQAQQPRISVELERQASLNILMHELDVTADNGNTESESPASWLNVVTQVSLEEGAQLSLYRLQQHGPRFFETSLLSGYIGKDATFTVGYVDLGGRLVRNDIDIVLGEAGASVDLFGVFLAGADQHIDNHTHIEHAAPHTRSRENFRGMADGNGHGVFHGMVVVQPGAQRIDSEQSSDNLLLGEHAEINTSPMLEIYADDVKCSHGATIGEIDEAQLFYLQSRGIDAQQARDLLTFAFAARVLERLPGRVRERAASAIAGQLPGRGMPTLPLEAQS